MYSYPTIEEPQLADQDWYPTTQDFFSYPVPTVADHEPSPNVPQQQPQLFRPQYMVRSSSFSPTLDQLSSGSPDQDFKTLMTPASMANPRTQFTATRMKRSYTQPEHETDTLRRSQSMMALSISTDGRARLQPRAQSRDHSPHKLRIEEDLDSQSSYSDNVFSDRSSMSSASSASPQLASDFPSCVPVPVGVSRSKSCVSLSQFGAPTYPSLPPPAVSAASSVCHSPLSSPSPSASSSSDEEEEVAPKQNDACVALARLVARKRSKSLKMSSNPQRPPHIRSRSLVGSSDSSQSRTANMSTMESYQSRARRACAPVVPPTNMLTPPTSATSDKGFDFGMPRTSMRSISPKRGRTSMAVAFNYTDDSPHSHFHRRQMSLSDLSQLSLHPVQPEWSN